MLPEQLSAALSDRYRLEREIGQGGMATVWLARDLRHDRDVALKVLRPDLAARLGPERFLSEIRIAARLDHPHILTLIDSGATDGVLWYVLPYVRGDTLRTRLDRERQLPVDEAVSIATQVAGALAYAHRNGVVHRDVKPENIMFQEGEAVLTDFGIALAVQEAGGNRLTETGLSLGTPQYMSPEQATGDRAIDARSDIYSLGAVLYEMLAGDPPHSGSTVQAVVARLLTERPTSLRTLRETVSPALEHAVMRALAKVPADRWPDARAFADALQHTLATRAAQPVAAAGASPRRRSNGLLMGAAVLVIALVVAVYLALRPSPQYEPRVLGDPPRTQITNSGDVLVPMLSPDGQRLAFGRRVCDSSCRVDLVVRDLRGAGEIVAAGNFSAAYELAWSPDGRYLLIAATNLAQQVGFFLIPSLGGAPRYLGPDWTTFFASADTLLQLQFRADSSPILKLMPALGGRPLDSIALPHWVGGEGLAVPSHSGAYIAVMSFSGQELGDARLPLLSLFGRNGALRDSFRLPGQVFQSPQWLAGDAGFYLPVGDSLQGGGALVVRWDVDPRRGTVSRQPVALLRMPISGRPYISLSADSRTFTYVQGGGGSTLHTWTSAGRARPPFHWSERLSRTDNMVADLSPSGKWIAISKGGIREPSAIELLTFDGGPPRTIASSVADLVGVEWSPSPDDEQLYYAARERNGLQVHIVDPNTLTERAGPVLPDAEFLDDFEPLADGRIAWVDDRRKLWIRGLDGRITDLTYTGNTVRGVHAPPRGSTLVTAEWRTPNFDSLDVLAIDPDRKTTRRIWSGVAEGGSLGWQLDGTLMMALIRAVGSVELYELRPDGSPAVPLGPLPFGDAVYRFAVTGERGIAVERNAKQDVWMVKDWEGFRTVGGRR